MMMKYKIQVMQNNRDAMYIIISSVNKEITLSPRWPRGAPNMWVPWKL